MKITLFIRHSMILLIVFFFTSSLQAQPYKAAVGARLGSPLSASIKTFISESTALEAYVGFRSNSVYNWVSVSGAFQRYQPLESIAEGLYWYTGGGVSVYFWSFDNVLFESDYNATTFGIQGYLGLDYKFGNIPLNLSVDWIPTYFFNSYVSGFGGGYGSLGVRYTFGG